VLNAILCALCNAVGTLTVRGLTRTEASASIVFYTALFMTLMALPALPFSWVAPSGIDLMLFCSIGLIGGVSQYWTAAARGLSARPGAAYASSELSRMPRLRAVNFSVVSGSREAQASPKSRRDSEQEGALRWRKFSVSG
jgi:hypothetical protein